MMSILEGELTSLKSCVKESLILYILFTFYEYAFKLYIFYHNHILFYSFRRELASYANCSLQLTACLHNEAASTQPHSCIYILDVAAFFEQQQNAVVVTQTT